MTERYPHVNKAHQYCRDILSGKIPACLWVKLACQRHLNNLARENDKKYPFRFDREKAERICELTELQVHVKGKWAGEFIRLEPWQCFIFCSGWGWVQKKDGFRRFRLIYVEVPRKNGKSVLAAGAGNFMFLADGEGGAEIYSGATTEKQAWEVFRPAKLMIERSPDIKSFFGVETFAKSMFHFESASRFEPVIGTPGDGSSPHLAIVDEYHEHKTSDLFDTMNTGMGARSQPMMLVITTAGSNTAGPCKVLHDHIEKILQNVIENDRNFGIIYSIDKDDDWTDFEVWKKANPNYEVSINTDFLLQQYQDAMQVAAHRNIIRCKHLNQWLSVDTAWMDMLKLSKCKDVSLVVESMKDKRCVIGLDLASKIDLAAVLFLFYDDKEYWAFGKYYSPRATVDKPENQHYQTWELEERLEVTPGEVIDFGLIEEDVKSFCKQFQVDGITYDPWNATQFASNLSAQGFNMIEISPNAQNFSEPMKLLEAAIYTGYFHYDGCPVLTWMFSNVVAHYDKKENIFPNKISREKKIDGVVAMITAMNAVLRLRGAPEQTPGIFFM
ncbi:MAG: terminase large subunit [Candidatus Riflebacteria bacterium]|nr:terminase large subunit [Candidatus Riflebacteria bacterium]